MQYLLFSLEPQFLASEERILKHSFKNKKLMVHMLGKKVFQNTEKKKKSMKLLLKYNVCLRLNI